jgi:hypothetical protein
MFTKERVAKGLSEIERTKGQTGTKIYMSTDCKFQLDHWEVTQVPEELKGQANSIGAIWHLDVVELPFLAANTAYMVDDRQTPLIWLQI